VTHLFRRDINVTHLDLEVYYRPHILSYGFNVKSMHMRKFTMKFAHSFK
jgi:hypothetical protein